MAVEQRRDIGELIADRGLVSRALAQAARAALLRHRQAGLPVAVWRDGAVAWVPAEEIDPTLGDETGSAFSATDAPDHSGAMVVGGAAGFPGGRTPSP
jgi:hypothetical protein